jgi:hypothetical protein
MQASHGLNGADMGVGRRQRDNCPANAYRAQIAGIR